MFHCSPVQPLLIDCTQARDWAQSQTFARKRAFWEYLQRKWSCFYPFFPLSSSSIHTNMDKKSPGFHFLHESVRMRALLWRSLDKEARFAFSFKWRAIGESWFFLISNFSTEFWWSARHKCSKIIQYSKGPLYSHFYLFLKCIWKSLSLSTKSCHQKYISKSHTG